MARPRSEFALATLIRQWAAQEVSTGRLLPWLAVAYGAGIVVYFTAEREPAWWAATALAAGGAAAAVVLRRHLVAFVAALGFAAMCFGFAVATVKTALIEHPVLLFPASGVTITGFVELREESQHTDRMVVRVERMEGTRLTNKLQRVRLQPTELVSRPMGQGTAYKTAALPLFGPMRGGNIHLTSSHIQHVCDCEDVIWARNNHVRRVRNGYTQLNCLRYLK